jgi:cytidylate kinase
MSSKEYVGALMRVVHTIHEHGRAVIIGRGVQFIVGADAALRVRVVRPFAERAQSFAREHAMSLEAARARITEIDHERVSFINDAFRRDVKDPTAYDLIVNTGTLSLDQAADTVIAAYHAKFPATHDD